ncbi:MAG: RNA polymerase sigma factor, partial [Limisphaerales bacterium]
MSELDDAELLSAYVSRQSEEAFSMLVERYIALVYSAALRQVQNPDQAKEVTQAVFIVLAQKAGKLSETKVLAGWLCRTAHFVARNARRTEYRRLHREQEAYMQSLLNESDTKAWAQMSPLLDEAVAQLNELDRNAVVLRFYQQKPLHEVGNILGVDPDTAQKRVSRALDKLRRFFSKRGVVSTTAIIAGAISGNSVQAAPIGLAGTVTATAVHGAAVSSSTITLVKGALKLMAWTKAKTAVVVGVGVLLAAGT